MEAKLFARKSRNFSDASGREVDYGSKLTSKSEVCPKWYNVVQISGATLSKLVLNYHLDLVSRNSRRGIVFVTPCM